MQREDTIAFWQQFEEVDRAIANLAKSGKLLSLPSQRHPVPLMAAPGSVPIYDPRMGTLAPRPHSVSGFDPMRSSSVSNLQISYASLRFQQRLNEAEQRQQDKRRMEAGSYTNNQFYPLQR